jgi:opine dehydrogenase
VGQKISIIGAGNGGQAFAGYLALKGHDVAIFDVFQDTIDRLNKRGGIEIVGNSDITGFGKINFASTDISQVLRHAEVVFVILPSAYHASIAKLMANHLRDGQLVLLNPAAPLGILTFRKVLKESGCGANVILSATATLLFAARLAEPGKVNITGQKICVGAAALPSSLNPAVQKLLADIMPQLRFEYDIIRIGLDNLNGDVHPGPVLLNTGRIEGGIEFDYYLDMTPSQALLLEAVDKERMAIGAAFGLELRNFVDEFKLLYPDTKGGTAYELLRNNKGYVGIKGPTSMHNRYLFEDVPYGLVAWQTLGKIAQTPTPCIDSIIVLANAIIRDLDAGSSLDALGLNGVTKAQFLELCRTQTGD